MWGSLQRLKPEIMIEHIELIEKEIQSTLERLPRAIKGKAPVEHLNDIVYRIDLLIEIKEIIESQNLS